MSRRILGFGNNFTYWVLITAAVDILARTGAQASLKCLVAMHFGGLYIMYISPHLTEISTFSPYSQDGWW